MRCWILGHRWATASTELVPSFFDGWVTWVNGWYEHRQECERCHARRIKTVALPFDDPRSVWLRGDAPPVLSVRPAPDTEAR